MVVLSNSIPIFVDVNQDTFLLDVNSLEHSIGLAKDLGLNPKVIIPVDLFGQNADYENINRIAKREKMFVLSDAAQAFGSVRNERKAGVLADATATSFFPAKPLGCYGDGGAIFTDDENLAQGLKSLRIHGKGNNKYQAEHEELFSSIRSGKPINDGTRMAKTSLMAIMGRMAAYTGREISWEQALNSQQQLVPDQMDWNTKLEHPPLAIPGLTDFT